MTQQLVPLASYLMRKSYSVMPPSVDGGSCVMLNQKGVNKRVANSVFLLRVYIFWSWGE